MPYQLGYATKIRSGCGGETRTRTPSFTRRVLCYPIELRRNLVDWEGFKPSQEVCRTSMLSVTSPARRCWWLWVESNHQPRAYETLALIPLELHSRLGLLEARGGVEPRAFPPSSYRFGLEDRRRERGPDFGGDGEIRTHPLLFTGQPLCQLELHRQTFGRGVRPTTPLRTPLSLTVTVLPG